MLTPKEIKNAPSEIEALFLSLEEEVMRAFGEGLKERGKVKESDLYAIEVLEGYQRRLDKRVRATLKEAEEKADGLILDSALKSYLDDSKRYKEAGKHLLDYEANARVQRLVKRLRRQTRDEFKDLSRGLSLIDLVSKNAHSLNSFYKKAIDRAVFSSHLGVFSYEEASKKLIDDLSERGLVYLNFETGTKRTLTGHIHTLVRTSLGQLSNQMTELNLEAMGECYVEVSAHSGARETHASWQGGQYYWREKDREGEGNKAGYPDFIQATGYGTGEGLGGYNCRHTFYPFFPDSSTPAYTDKALKDLAEETREYKGVSYTVYEANQKLRAYERAIRKSKRKLVGYEALGSDDAFLYESVRLRLVRDEYRAFARGVGLPVKLARTEEVGYNRGISERSELMRRNFQKQADDIFKVVDKTESRAYLLLKYRHTPFLQERLDFIDENTNEKSFIPNFTEINYAKTIAKGESLRARERLAREYGGEPDKWEKKVGRIDSRKYMYDVHWYEYDNKQYLMKVKIRKERKS